MSLTVVDDVAVRIRLEFGSVLRHRRDTLVCRLERFFDLLIRQAEVIDLLDGIPPLVLRIFRTAEEEQVVTDRIIDKAGILVALLRIAEAVHDELGSRLECIVLDVEVLQLEPSHIRTVAERETILSLP